MMKECDLCKGVGFESREADAKPVITDVLLDTVCDASNNDSVVKIDKRRKEHRVGV